jgi:hypothetical protein
LNEIWRKFSKFYRLLLHRLILAMDWPEKREGHFFY